MSTKFERIFNVDAPIERVVAAMRSQALIEESEMSRDAISVKISDKEKTDTRHAYEVLVVSPARTVKGIDKTKTEENRTTVTWTLADHAAKWVWAGAHGPRVKIDGGYQLTPSGNATKLKMYAEITVDIPLVGGAVERKVRDGFEGAWPDYVARVEKHAKR